ncbi:thioredoxin reductase 2, mitochondrial-like [Neocloeon triangulifer]|uniref:thioredoxin reductase 2, mitochondrial-like n=1 Tax=Neocloeon triangulifer TaxID=2078957 RepID=UPI00286F0586|nr:thioredoxin reductase 2, mitochondrial-like [Neocloeon triangulifer]
MSASEGMAKCDLLVIGGGSGGLACAKEAANFGAKVVLVDYVLPSVRGTCWGIGGTCLNVGCIPKKLMHHSALLGLCLKDAKHFGWSVSEEVKFNWKTLRDNIAEQINCTRTAILEELQASGIEYINGQACFQDKNTIMVNMKDQSMRLIQADKVVVAVGMRPKYPDVPGAREYAISSDDIFSLETPPGKTLVVGAGFVGMECASYLLSLGFPVTLMTRSPPLQRLDKQMVSLVMRDMADAGLRILSGGLTTSLCKTPEGTIEVKWEDLDKKLSSETFDTVFYSIGREVDIEHLCLDHIGVKTSASGKIVVDLQTDQTSLDNIFSIGDCAAGVPELAPVAQMSGKLLAGRLFGQKKLHMDYKNIPTCLFTTLEYSSVGLSEEKAIELYGEDGVQVHHMYYVPTEFTLAKRDSSKCYLKVISSTEIEKNTVLGVHFAGLNAGEIIQGFACAVKCGLTLDQLLSTVGVHPTVAQEFTKLRVRKGDGPCPGLPDYFG